MTTDSTDWKKRLVDRVSLLEYGDPKFAGEYRAEQHARRRSILDMMIYGFMYCFGIPLFGFAVPIGLFFLSEVADSETIFAAVGLLLTLAPLAIAEFLMMKLHQSPVVSVSSHLPASDSVIVRNLWWRQVIPVSLIGLWYLLFLNCGLTFGVLGIHAGFLAALFFAAMQWGFCLGLGILLAWKLPRCRHGLILFFIVLVTMGCVYSEHPVALMLIQRIALISPGAWAGDALWLGVLEQQPILCLAAIPALLILLFSSRILNGFANSFQIKEFLVLQGQEVRSIFGGTFRGAERGRFAASVAGEQTEPPETPEISEQHVRNYWQHLEQDFDWTKRGWIERLIAGWLSPRERKLVTFMTGDITYWSYSWNLIIWMIGFFLLIALARDLPILDTFWLPFGLFFIVSSSMDDFPGFQRTRCSGSFVPHFANYPLSTTDLSRVYLKISLIRTLLLCLWTIPLLLFQPPEIVLAAAVILLTLLMSFAFWRLAIHLSSGLVMPRSRFSNLWIPLLVFFLFCESLAGAILSVVFATRDDQSLIAALSICLISSVANWRLIRWLVDRDRIDLVTAKEPIFQQYTEQMSNQQSQVEESYLRHLDRREKYGYFWWWRRLFAKWNNRQRDST